MNFVRRMDENKAAALKYWAYQTWDMARMAPFLQPTALGRTLCLSYRDDLATMLPESEWCRRRLVGIIDARDFRCGGCDRPAPPFERPRIKVA